MEEGLEIARRLEAAGVDALHVDVGCYESWHTTIPPVYAEPACQIDVAAFVETEEGREQIDADSVVLAMGFRSNNDLARELAARGKGVIVIGDAQKPRKVLDAVWEGFHAARLA